MNFRPLLTSATLAAISLPALGQDKVNFNDHVLPIFRNACLNCHNPDKKKAGLDLSTYQATLLGSDNGKVLESGKPENSLLLKTCKHTEEPKMPPKGDKLTEPQLALLEKWIAGQLLESAGGKVVAVSNNVQVAVVSLTRPEGPAPMPAEELPLEPVVRTKTSNALVALAGSPWAPLVAVGGQKQIILYHAESLQPMGILPFPEGIPSVVRFSRNGQLLLTGGGQGGRSGKVVLWKVATGERAGEVGKEFDQVLGADLSPDHGFVALGGPTKLLKIYATKDGQQVHSLKKHTDWVTAVVFSPDGRYLASADRSGGVVVWEGSTGKEFVTLPGHKVIVTSLAFMPGVLASAAADGKIVLWDVKEGKEIRSWNAHPGGVESVDFTPDGRLVSCGRDRVAKAWDQNGKLLCSTEQFGDIALRAVLCAERLVAGDWSGNIRVFEVPTGKRVGELTANPPMIAEQISLQDSVVKETTAKLAQLEPALVAAEAKLKAEREALQAQRTADLAAAAKPRQEAEAALQALSTAAEEKALAEAKAAHEAATKAVETAPADQQPALKTHVEEKAKAVATAEAQLKKVQGEQAAKRTALQAQVVKANEAVAAIEKVALKLPPAPESVAKLAAAEKKLKVAGEQVAALQETYKKAAANSPAQKKAGERVAAATRERSTLLAAYNAAKAEASAAPSEHEVARLQAALAETKSRLAMAQDQLGRWQRAQAFMAVHRSKVSLADLQAKFEGTTAAAGSAMAPAQQAEAELQALEKKQSEGAEAIRQQSEAVAKLKAESTAAAQALAAGEKALAEAQAKSKAATAAFTKVTAETAAATAKLEPSHAALAKAEAALEKAATDAEKKDAEAKKTAAAAEVAKLQAASDAAIVAIAPAKAAAEQARTALEAARGEVNKLRPAAKALAGKVSEAEKAFAAAQAEQKARETKIAELRQKAPEIRRTAEAAKAKADAELAKATQELDAAKAQHQRTRTEFEARYRPFTQPVAKSG